MILGKKQMTEEDIKLQYITPAITAKWSQSKITMETKVTDGRINLKGNVAVREKPKKADYILYLNANNPIAIVEAKDNNHTISHGLQQAITYAQMLDIQFRHRFAKSFLDRCNDIAFLADLMGHESIETTRIYLRKTATEQREIVDKIVDW